MHQRYVIGLSNVMRTPDSKAPNFLTCPIEGQEFPSASEVERVEDREEQMPESVSRSGESIPPIRSKRRVWLWAMVSILVVCAITVVPPGVACVKAGLAANRAKQDLDEARRFVQVMDVGSALEQLSSAQLNIQEAHTALDGTGFWRDVPGVGTQIRGLQDATAVATQMLDGIRDVVTVVQSMREALNGGIGMRTDLVTGQIAPNRSFHDLTQSEKRDFVAMLANALPRFRIARDKIDVALELWNRVPQDGLIAPIRSALKPLAEQLPLLKQSIDEAVPLLEVSVAVAGYPSPTRFLILLQNADELRPGGGFIGNVGTMTLDAGDMTEMTMGDVYAVDNPVASTWKEVAPKQMRDRLSIPAWFLRDANWSPDFPTSAARVLDFYIRETELGTGKKMKQPPSVVIAIQPAFVEALFRLAGPVEVDGVSYTATNFFDSIEYEVEQGFLTHGILLDQRKVLLQRVQQALMSKIFSMPASRWPDLLSTLTTSLSQKEVMLYSSQPSLLALFDARGWTGRTVATRGDFVWVVDANLGALKTDGVMKKRVTYQLDAKDPKQLTGTVTLTYTNTNRQIDWRYTRYQSYTRVYVPEGAELLSVGGTSVTDVANVDVVKELGKTVFGSFWSVDPGKTGILRYTYRLPVSVADSMIGGTYALDWPKQPGADETEFSVDALFGANVLTAVPAEEKKNWGDARYTVQTDSAQDRSFTVKLQAR